MKKRVVVGLVGVMSAIALTAAGGASAATEVGSKCVPTTAPPGTTLIQLASDPAELPVAMPAGVLTQWKINLPAPGTFAQTLKIARATGNPGEFKIVAEDPRTITFGLNTFDVRIPVEAGDRLGLLGGATLGALACNAPAADAAGQFIGEATLGSSQTYLSVPNVQVAVSGTVEPDADGDHFGDDTQDKCSRSGALQTECPLVSVGSFAFVRNGSVLVLVATSNQAPVKVSGTLRLGKKKVKLSAGTRTVSAGKIVQFKLKLTSKVKAKLRQLDPKQSLKLKVQAAATDLAGKVTRSASTLRLSGQG
jgi:hypothetical protein